MSNSVASIKADNFENYNNVNLSESYKKVKRKKKTCNYRATGEKDISTVIN